MSETLDLNAAVYPFPPKPVPLSQDEKAFYKAKIKTLLKQRNAVMVAHYYTDPEIQQLAEETGGCVADSLEMARFGSQHPASTLQIPMRPNKLKNACLHSNSLFRPRKYPFRWFSGLECVKNKQSDFFLQLNVALKSYISNICRRCLGNCNALKQREI